MALKDCIRKLGKLISREDRELLQSWLDEGIEDEAVVQRYLLAAEMDMLDVLRKAQISGEIQIRTPDVRATISEFATVAFDKAEKEYNRILADVADKQDEWARIQWIKETVQNYTASDEDLAAIGGRPVDLNDDQAVMQRLSAIFFANPDLFREKHLGGNLLYGNSPLAVFESWKEMLEYQQELLRDLEPLIAQKVELENRMEDLDPIRWGEAQQASARETFNQGPIDDGTPPKTEAERMQEELEFLTDEEADQLFKDSVEEGELEAVGAQSGMEQQRMARLMGAQLYGDMEKSHEVTVKELFQNAFDAVRTALNRGQITEGTIEFKVSEDGRTLTIIDNGVGMTPDMINSGFLTIAGTEKEGDVNSGGFGVAKGLFLAGNEKLTLETVRDGVRTTLSTTGVDYMDSLKDPTHSLDQRYPADRALRRSKTSDPSGTIITVTLPEKFRDFRTGTEKSIPDFSRRVIDAEVTNQLLDPRITVINGRWQIDNSPREANSGKHFSYHNFRSLGTVQFEWGTADILVEREEQSFAPYRNTDIHVNGLRQLQMNTMDNPWSFDSEKLKRKIHINISPNMPAGEAGYPFSLNRQELQRWAAEDIFQIQAYLAVLTWRDKTSELAKGYGVLKPIEADGSLGEQLELTPPPADAAASITGRIDTGELLEVRDGRLHVDGQPQERLDPENMTRTARPRADDFKVDQSLVPTDKPLMHSQMKFKDDASVIEQELGEGMGEVAGMDFTEALFDRFGQERVLNYFSVIGEAFITVRDTVAAKGDPNKFDGLDDVGVGVSVLGSDYYGVHTKVPAQMMFINPGADPRHSEMLRHMEQLIELSDGEQAKIIAASLMTTMLHEAAHFAEMSHDMDYIFALQSAIGTMFENLDAAQQVTDNLEDAIYDNRDIFDYISNALRSESIEPAGLSLTDVGSEFARVVGDARDTQGKRPADKEGARAAREDRPGDRTGREELDDEAISAGYREGGVVVPPGSVHPEAGQKSQLNKMIGGLPSTRINQTQTQAFKMFFEGSKVVDENGEPRVVYHGTQDAGFGERTEFIPQGGFGGWNNMGSWFSSERKHAERLTQNIEEPHGGVIPAYLSIKNPLETDWDTLQNEIKTAIDNWNKDNPNETPLNPWGGTQGSTSRVGKFLNQHFKKQGYDGIIIKNWTGDGQPAQDVYVAFDSNQIKHATGNRGTFDKASANIYEQDRRGYIEFDELRKGYIRLTEASDFSTFIHETGHLYLEILRRVAAMEDAPQQIKDDYAKILNFLGVTDGSQITTEHHEKWARAFEAYTMEGKAPSLELQDAFNSFRRWLMAIYRKLTQMANVQLDDEIRGVMDRMLATDEQIKLAEESQGFSALFLTAEEAGMSQEEFTLYKRRLQRAHDDAVDKETRRLIQAMQRDQKAWWKSERQKVQGEVEEEAYRTRVYVALSKLQKDQLPNGDPSPTAPLKIDKESLLRLVSGDQSIINRLPKPYIYTLEGGTDVEVVAQILGYKDAMQMVKEMIGAPKMKTWIKAETDRRMLELYPDPLFDGTLADNAVRAVHDYKRAEILAAEMKALRRMIREDRPAVRAAQQATRRQEREAIAANKAQMPSRKEVQMIRAAARQAIGNKQIRNIKPHMYLAAERKAGRLAFEAMRRRDYQAAYQHKLQQIHALEMWRAATKAQDDAKSGQKYLAKFERPTIQRKMGKAGVLESIQAILEGVDLRRRSLKQVDKDKALRQLRKDVEDGRFIVTPATLARIFDDRVNWQDLTLDEFLAMRDLVKQIEHSAVASNKHYVNGEWVEFSEVEAEVAESLYENNKRIELRPGGVRTPGEQASRSIDQGIRTWLRPSSIARVLDKSGFGAMTRRIIAPMRRAYAEKLIPMLHKAQEDVAKIFNQHYTAGELGQLAKRNIRIEALDNTYSRAELISMALNWGSQTNREAVLGGVDEGKPVFTQKAVDEMLAHLTAKDWGFVQAVWDYLDTYREDLFEAEKRRRGVAPQKVEPLPFTVQTADGQSVTLAGGYYPLRYDSSYEAEAAPQDIQDEFKRVAFGSMVTANTRAGATYNRVKNHGKVVRLGLNNIDTHLREIIRDIAIGDEVLYIKRLLDSREVRRAFKKTNNESSLEALNLWLTDAAVGELPSENIWESTTSWIRTGFTKAKLGWNMAVMFLQFTGVFQTMAVIGSTNYAYGLGKFMQNPRAAWKHVMEVSKFLNARYEIGAWNKDVQDTRAHLESFFGTTPTRGKVLMTRLAYTYFLPIAKAQQVVDITTWLGAYHKAVNELELGEQDAIIYADTQVEAAQTSGFFSDRSGFERGTSGLRKNRQSQWIRIWSTLLSYMLAKGNIAYEKTKTTNFRKPSQVAKYTADMFLLFTVEGIASAILYGRLPDEDDEPEDWATWVAAVTADSAISGVPYARELLAAKYGGGNTPVGVFLNDSWRLIEQAGQGEADAAAIDAFLDVVGTATHTPTGQISKTFKAIWVDEDTELYEYLLGPRKD